MDELSDIFKIAEACGTWKKYSRGVMILCPCHTDKNPSCAVWPGDHAILVKCFAGCDSKDIVDTLRGMGFTMSLRESDARKKRNLSQVIRAARPVIDQNSRVRTMLARALWDEAREAGASPVADYLTQRGLSLAVVPHLDHTIRYHPHCPRGKERHRAMLCSLRDIATDELIGIHRTFIDSQNRKDGQPMMLGSPTDTAIKLMPHADTFDHKRHFVSRLYVCEGVETGIGAMMQNYSPVWSLGTAGAIARLEPLLSVGELVVLADHDEPGIAAAHCAVRRWREAGWAARFELPDHEGDDFADQARRYFAHSN